MDFTPFIIPISSGVVIALVTQSVAYYYSKKSLEAQRENSLKIARMQLYHEETKEALVRLDELLKKSYKTFPDFKKTVNEFLDGSAGIFLPKKLRLDLKKKSMT
jgi:hypothetical protein